MARTPDMHWVSFIMTMQISPFANIIRYKNVVRQYFVCARFDLFCNFEELKKESKFNNNREHAQFLVNDYPKLSINYFVFIDRYTYLNKSSF